MQQTDLAPTGAPGQAKLGDWVFLNGAFVRGEDAQISVNDRGFLFAHAAYEVTAVYNGKLIDFEQHMARLQRTLSGIEIAWPDLDFAALHAEIMQRNGLSEGLVYVQVTAGAPGPRDYYGPESFIPTVYVFVTHKQLIGDVARDGLTAISFEDTRWRRRDLKTTQLLTQTLAYRAARRAGADTAILHENGIVTEAASANLWIIDEDGKLITRDLSTALLPGITRDRLLHVLGADDLQIEERAFTLEELGAAREAFTSSTGVVIAPVLSLDKVRIGSGRPGPVTRKVQAAYYQYIGADVSQLTWL
nr:aminotransferase class IV [Hyphomonas sp. Mor2]